MSPTFVAQLFRPRGLADLVIEPHQDHVEVVKVSEILLEAGERGREPPFVLRVERHREVGDLSGPTDADSKPVEAFHRGPTPGLAVRLLEQGMGARVGQRHSSMSVAKRPGPRQAAQPFSDIVQETGLTLRAKESPQELTAGARRPGRGSGSG